MAQLVDQHGNALLSETQATKRDAARRLQARYDAAQPSDELAKHWSQADHLSPAASANEAVRKKLRSRARYEIGENNSFAKGLILTLAKDLIKTGPRLKVETDDPRVNREIERPFNRWAQAVRLAKKLRTGVMSKKIDGEIFLQQTTNERLPTDVKLGLQLLEGDQVTTPELTLDPNAVDGIVFDDDGEPVEYHVLTHHPGTDRNVAGRFHQFDRVDAERIIHWYREDRPGQSRGIPEVTPALPLFALLRRFLLATIRAAETAADFSGVLFTDSPAADPDEVDPMDAIELELRSMLTLPQGWKMDQVQARHPATTFEMFRDAIISEVARCLLIPFNKALGKSQGYTFASGKLDRDDYIEAIETERSELETEVLDRILMWWLDEAVLVPGLLPDGIGRLVDLPHSWSWDGFREADPNKQAAADVALWERGLLSDEEILRRRGRDPERHYVDLTEQNRRRREAGAPIPGEKDREPPQVVPADDGSDE